MKTPFFETTIGGASCRIFLLPFDGDPQGELELLREARQSYPGYTWIPSFLQESALEILRNLGPHTESHNNPAHLSFGIAAECIIGVRKLDFETLNDLVREICQFRGDGQSADGPSVVSRSNPHDAMMRFFRDNFTEETLKLQSLGYRHFAIGTPNGKDLEAFEKLLKKVEALLRELFPGPARHERWHKEFEKSVRMWRKCCWFDKRIMFSSLDFYC